MKRLSSVILAGILCLSTLSVCAEPAPALETIKNQGPQLIQTTLTKFGDVKSGEWYVDSVSKLVGLGGIAGYDDGTFRPSGTITRAEYTSIVARSLGLKPVEGLSGHWSAGIMAAATEAGLVKSGEFNDVTSPITRNEMARMAVRAVEYQKEAVPEDYGDYAPLMTDINASAAFKEDVTKVVAMGIISGYPDKTFQGTRTLSRAEASAVVIRILDKDARKVPAKPSAVGTIKLGETKPATEFISNLPDLAKFNPNLKTVTLVTPESLGLTAVNTGGIVDLQRPGHTGVIVAIKDGKSLTSFSGLYSATKNITYYVTTYFPVDYKTIDYFGFYRSDGKPDVQLVANPWKE